MRLFYGVNDARQGGIVGGCGDLVFQRAGLVDGAGEDFIAHGLFNRQAFTGDRCLVDGGLASGDFAVQANALAGFYSYDGTKIDAFDFFFQPRAVSLLNRGLFRGHLHQAADGIARTVQGLGFDQLSHSKQEHHHRGFGPLADQDRARHGDAHQRVDVQVEVFQGDPALFVGGEAAAEDRHQRHQSNHPGRCDTGEMQHLGTQRADARHCKRPPVFLGRRRSGRGAFFNRIGLHTEGLDGVDDRRRARQVMGDAEHAVDQVEFQLLHTRELAQFVLDQRLLGWAVHGFDAKGAQARAGGRRFAQRDHGRRGLACTAGAGMAGVVVLFDGRQFGAVIVIVIVIVIVGMIVLKIMIMRVIMLFGGVDGVAHSVASVKVPVAK